ncbi:MAG: hypothetical protein HY842_08925 [Bacteroidetes bacterium]|nr:hypothetical protein [Bacteroidota bacterium]
MQVSANLHPYWLLLKDLNLEQKLSLIELLVQSVKTATVAPKKNGKKEPEKPKDDWVYKYYGSWKDFPETAEEMISLIEGSRTMGREIEAL